MEKIIIIGGGLAGSEAAYQIATRGGGDVEVELIEMKPAKFSPAHKLEGLAELVCSNSLKSTSLENSSGLLKEEMRLLDSLIIRAAYETRVPAGGALAVDRERFSKFITKALKEIGVKVIGKEATELPVERPLIIATGPLTSDDFASAIAKLLGSEHLYFYDAVAPIVTAESINMDRAFKGSRYGKSGDDYINCPMDKETYERFVSELISAETTGMREFEEAKYFEGCLPIEVMAARGPETLSFGPLKPVGLTDESAEGEEKERPYAVVQLRRENIEDTLYNLVGFQTRLKYGEQKRIFSMIPGLENAEFVRLGKIHRNSFIDSPRLLNEGLELKGKPGLFFAGQLTGVEGYLESAVSGLMAGINSFRALSGEEPLVPPETTITGALMRYVCGTDMEVEAFQPMNANFGLLPAIPKPKRGKIRKKERRALYTKRALEDMKLFIEKSKL
ncbi:MAG: methylenetetrahydrofolate--tRNA-(uracil(54)-C(5))-methyltransferase (FADH(2)-oxidizing) TrmFO [Proteobacteria bacterium]|nr:methylenetetrahydrofolate--tRNA-(uracil(54)-C(5))-methyltransferase (FADH(2)-oxidizing) TrmFO [Pseudomonadota bacterium]